MEKKMSLEKMKEILAETEAHADNIQYYLDEHVSYGNSFTVHQADELKEDFKAFLANTDFDE